ncbi:MAG: serine hydrolase, partial [Candidatus Heimdallarchaeota archaeon]|nr:serine hydrolase [Candidatus Heimdallarchaeota archaeon]
SYGGGHGPHAPSRVERSTGSIFWSLLVSRQLPTAVGPHCPSKLARSIGPVLPSPFTSVGQSPQTTWHTSGIPSALSSSNSPEAMSHSSGIPNLGSAEIAIGQSFPIPIPLPEIPLGTWEDLYSYFNQAQGELFYKPGDHFHYFNGGYIMLSDIVAKASGMSFIDYIEDKILKPLQMSRSSLHKSKVNQDDNLSVPYVLLPDKDGKSTNTPASFPFSEFIYGPGGLISSTNEMMNYVRMSMNSGNFNGTQIFDSSIITEMQKVHQAYDETFALDFDADGYGFGWSSSSNFFGDTLIMHSGGITGGISTIGFLKEAKLGFTLIGNSGNTPLMEILAALALLLGKNPDTELKIYVRQNHFSKLSGKYSTFGGIGVITVSVKFGLLFVDTQIPPQSIPLVPIDDSLEPIEFYTVSPISGSKLLVKFRFDDAGKAHCTFERNSYHQM